MTLSAPPPPAVPATPPIFMGYPEDAPEIEPYLVKRGKVRNVYAVPTPPAAADDDAIHKVFDAEGNRLQIMSIPGGFSVIDGVYMPHDAPAGPSLAGMSVRELVAHLCVPATTQEAARIEPIIAELCRLADARPVPDAIAKAAERVVASFDEPFYGPDVLLVCNHVLGRPGPEGGT